MHFYFYFSCSFSGLFLSNSFFLRTSLSLAFYSISFPCFEYFIVFSGSSFMLWFDVQFELLLNIYVFSPTTNLLTNKQNESFSRALSISLSRFLSITNSSHSLNLSFYCCILLHLSTKNLCMLFCLFADLENILIFYSTHTYIPTHTIVNTTMVVSLLIHRHRVTHIK